MQGKDETRLPRSIFSVHAQIRRVLSQKLYQETYPGRGEGNAVLPKQCAIFSLDASFGETYAR